MNFLSTAGEERNSSHAGLNDIKPLLLSNRCLNFCPATKSPPPPPDSGLRNWGMYNSGCVDIEKENYVVPTSDVQPTEQTLVHITYSVATNPYLL